MKGSAPAPEYPRGPNGEKWLTKKAAQDALRKKLVDTARGELVEPSRQQCGDYLDEWLDGLRLAPSTVASYRKNVRLHLRPRLGTVPLAALTTERINMLYRELERSGRADHREGEGLSPRTVRYVHTILSAALAAAVKSRPPRLAHNPAAAATPPTAKEAQAPEMHPWTAGSWPRSWDGRPATARTTTCGTTSRTPDSAAAKHSRGATATWTRSRRRSASAARQA